MPRHEIIEAEKRNISGKIGFMANVVNDQMKDATYDAYLKSNHIIK